MPTYQQIAKDLKQYLFTNHTPDETSALIKELIGLHTRMTMYNASGTLQTSWTKGETTGDWLFKGSSGVKLADNVRLAEYELTSLLGDGKAKLLHPTSQCVRLHKDTVDPPILQLGQHSDHVQKSLVKYLRLLLGEEGELKEQAALAASICQSTSGYTPVVTVDYYTWREASNVSLHKDTMGFTLFVALHYLNPDRMLGPEYVLDRKPVEAKSKEKSDEGLRNPHWKGPWLTSSKRSSAPWAKDGSKTNWPDVLLKGLAEARRTLPNPKKIDLEYCTISPYGLICFVDELVYHTTPLAMQRKDWYTDPFTEVKTGGTHTLYRNKLQRRISLDHGNKPLPSKTGGMKQRAFLRLWISIVPEDEFYEPA